ncbi:4Fe-4S dicluster domain-containing protein [Ruegeria pomeroyi]|uniref:Iron-sulfur cluster-binding protein n=2 Tax=Ruegeria pomeroyi TaxID=89184 RepID=Q5LWU2_RUEPO|nr:4Fe-4S dicluster domain-containing protein [Ruegeria pomeroyi]HCE70440.1 epoxyqueuosine reductase [Ruegeria sp.]AAV93471.1 iron-sulfur cluster-binding protein [Ruegeria pomeroyi DSS-3]NVK96535.1 epoxyqueuosine reductase [Ruegeria pomeroyi]NVL00775.1 epoxyqueuosine reductase [Ruegeria pomeroyi]QWV10764.1 4Fe-4S dicluster domain-containing protein [Ruegeria pomeroyi]
MARTNPHRPFVPDPEQAALAPGVSGNDINGLGETAFRRPRMVYWAPDPDDIPHGSLQRYFYRQSAKEPDFASRRAARQAVLDAPLPLLADTVVIRDPADWTAALTQFVDSGLCDLTGVAEMNPDWVFEGHEIPQSRVIMIGVAHDYNVIATAPKPSAGLEVMTQYTRAAQAAKTIAGWLRQQGWQAEPLTGPMTGALAMIPPALACGFGELGKHGSIINPDLGASFRLSAVLSDAPFAPTPAQDHGIDGFCQNCHICQDACPPEALFAQKQTVRGARKWYVDFDKCLPFFNQTHGCAICIAECPWSRPGIGPNLAAKLARKRNRDATG